jgi:hypothetical protein
MVLSVCEVRVTIECETKPTHFYCRSTKARFNLIRLIVNIQYCKIIVLEFTCLSYLWDNTGTDPVGSSSNLADLYSGYDKFACQPGQLAILTEDICGFPYSLQMSEDCVDHDILPTSLFVEQSAIQLSTVSLNKPQVTYISRNVYRSLVGKPEWKRPC